MQELQLWQEQSVLFGISISMTGRELFWFPHARRKLVPVFPCFLIFQCLHYQSGKHFSPWDRAAASLLQVYGCCYAPHNAPILFRLN